MKLRMIVVLGVGFLLGADVPGNDGAPAERQKLQGTWELVSAITDGEKLAPETLRGLRLVIKEDRWTVSKDEKVLSEGSFRLDPSRNPKALDSQVKNAKTSEAGIYELSGPTLKYCYATRDGGPRPTEFASLAGSGHVFLVLERAKK